ncbi:MAG: hypothetical protein J07HQW2_02489 [Haloquadratum walsbyi J07HQW2]|uniref:Uncharacterized protein n=1 Tax=Haloquadratum walsbyi J07HQW2 TaxID=1238425 RepID=U1PQI1_9EURY|nr:MAG: hypothetical protein J07HQW2_02489 [Haloquadratum walsbyi J07HQW2]
MDDKLINSAHLSLSRKSRLPGAGFFYPDSTDDDDEDTHETVATADVVVIADADADGLGCVALLREMYDATIAWDEFEPVVADRLTRWERGTDTSSRETHDTDEMSDLSNGDVPSDAVETETNSEVEDVDADADEHHRMRMRMRMILKIQHPLHLLNRMLHLLQQARTQLMMHYRLLQRKHQLALTFISVISVLMNSIGLKANLPQLPTVPKRLRGMIITNGILRLPMQYVNAVSNW